MTLVKPYCWRARQALLDNDLTKAIAYLECGIKLAPEQLDLYLQRAQIFQYGLQDYSRALQDYRYILRELSGRPNPMMEKQCKQAMADMMAGAAV